MKKIVLLDPALSNNNNELSLNLGDCIISESTNKILKSIFTDQFEIIKLSTHSPLDKQHVEILKEAEMIFIGGSNLLSSHLLKYNQWKFFKNPGLFDYLFAQKFNMVLLGVGWWQYQDGMDWITKRFYRKVLSSSHIHSVRDNYTKQKLSALNGISVKNTSCPTTWELNGVEMDRHNLTPDSVVLTLTDYNGIEARDTDLIAMLLKHYKNIYFFPQGSRDLIYFESLLIYKNNKSRFTILSNQISSFFKFVQDSSHVDYIGTRLHGGIKCIQSGMQSLIVSVDNRATEISRDINLAVVERNETQKIEDWISGKSSYGKINLNLEAINTWKNQFSTKK